MQKSTQPTGKNHRSLDAIANDIHKLKRDNVFEEGALLFEAWATAKHGEWAPWLEDNGWSWNSADRKKAVFELGDKIPSLKILKLSKVTLYSLAEIAEDEDDDDLLPTIIKALVEHGAKKVQLKPKEADEIIRLARLRHEHGDLPEATLRALEEVKDTYGDDDDDDDDDDRALRKKIIAALKKAKPTTEEQAEKIISDIETANLKKQQSEEPRDPAYEQLLEAPEPPPSSSPSPQPQSPSSSPLDRLDAKGAKALDTETPEQPPPETAACEAVEPDDLLNLLTSSPTSSSPSAAASSLIPARITARGTRCLPASSKPWGWPHDRAARQGPLQGGARRRARQFRCTCAHSQIHFEAFAARSLAQMRRCERNA